MIAAPSLAPNLHAKVTTRDMPGASVGPYARFNLGTHVGDDPAAVAANRAALIEAARLPSPPRYLRQVHGTSVARFDATRGGEPEADAAVTATPGVVLAILTADCLPVLFAARDGSVIGAAHAGWRGLAAGVLERTLEAMAASDVVAYIGPAIGRAAYEVGEEVRRSMGADAGFAFESTRPGHHLCDLAAIAEWRLRAAGVRDVTQSRLCTNADARFYSHRRGDAGRFASLAWIERG